MSSVAQMLRQAEALKTSVSDSSKTISETWVSRQKLEDIYKKILLLDLEYALDKKVEQELWNHAFKNQITNLQTQAKDKQNVKRAEIQASLHLFLETASGFYLQFLQLICTTFKLDLPFRRKSAYYGILKEKTSIKLKVTTPKKSSCLYMCQHCLVHLGDIARYRQQIDQAQTYYWHAAYLNPFNGQPYNQLAILEAAKGNKLSTVFFYIRSLAVKVPFPVAATNLEKLYAKLTKETPDYKGKLSASEMITGFLQFHALIHLCTDLEKAEDLSDKLAAGLPAHVTSQSFPWTVLVQIVAINIFAMNHVSQIQDGDQGRGMMNGDTDMTDDEETCFNLVFTLTVLMLDILLQYTPKQEHKVRDYFTLPAVKLLLDWFKLNPQNFDRPVLKLSPLWGNLCKVLNTIQVQQTKDGEIDITKYEDLPLPEDGELRCFQPIEKAQSGYSYSKLPPDGLPSDIEVQLRCQRLLEHGRWILEEFPSNNISAQTKSGKLQFVSTTPVHTTSGSGKSVTLSTPSPRASTAGTRAATNNKHPKPAASPERRSTRQNVAIQAIIQKQAQNSSDNKPRVKDDPSSPKYLLGVPTSEPVFFKTGGGRQSNSTASSPQAQSSQSSPSPGKNTAGQTGGVLVLKNQEHLSQTTKSVTIQTPKSQSSWQPRQQQSVSSWQPQTKQQQQHQSQMMDKTGWSNSPTSPQGQPKPGQGQLMPWQQQQNVSARPQLSPQPGQGQWQFPGQPTFGRGEYRPRSPMTSQPGSGGHNPSPGVPNSQGVPQGPMYPQGGVRPNFTQGQTSAASQVQDQFNQDLNLKGQGQRSQMPPEGQMSQGQPGPTPGGVHNMSMAENRFSGPGIPNIGSGDGNSMSFGPRGAASGQGQLFRYPPPSGRFPPPRGFPAPPPDHNSSHPRNFRPGLQPSQMPAPPGGNTARFPGNPPNFSHAPGTERPPGNRGPMQFPQGQFMNQFPGFMRFPGPGNQMKSPLDGIFGQPRFSADEIPPNMADIIGTLSQMAIQPPNENVMPPPRVGPSTFQGHAEGTPKPESFYSQQRSSSVPTVNIDCEPKPSEMPTPTPSPSVQHHHHHQQQQQQQQQPGTYSLFSGSPWLTSGETKSIGSSPFSSQSSSMRNSPDPSSDVYSSEGKPGHSGVDMGLRYSSPADERLMKQAQAPEHPGQHGQLFTNTGGNMQSIWSQSQSPLERLLELQKQQRQTEPH